MSGDWKPGTLAMIRDKVTSDRSEWPAVKDEKGWFGTAPDMGWVSEADVTGVRPLVVLDLDEIGGHLHPNEVARGGVPTMLRDTGSTVAAKIADQIEAQTQPPRIPEPGYGAIVSSPGVVSRQYDRQHWIRGHKGWTNLDATGIYLNWTGWDDLIDPVLVREGVES